MYHNEGTTEQGTYNIVHKVAYFDEHSDNRDKLIELFRLGANQHIPCHFLTKDAQENNKKERYSYTLSALAKHADKTKTTAFIERYNEERKQLINLIDKTLGKKNSPTQESLQEVTTFIDRKPYLINCQYQTPNSVWTPLTSVIYYASVALTKKLLGYEGIKIYLKPSYVNIKV